MLRKVMIPRLIGLGLVAAILTLAPFTHASPPDQTWIAGFYDNADFDDVVLFITGVGALQRSLEWSPSIVAPTAGLVPSADRPVKPLRRVALGPSRAPPLASHSARGVIGPSSG